MREKHFSIFLLKLILVFVGGFLALMGPNVWAETFEEMYGKELKSIPYAYRVKYANESGKPWSEATYEERFNYLNALHAEEQAEQIEEQARKFGEDQLEMAKAMERQAKKMAEEQKEMEKEMLKQNKKIIDEQKKFQYYQKSVEQKNKIMMMRNQ